MIIDGAVGDGEVQRIGRAGLGGAMLPLLILLLLAVPGALVTVVADTLVKDGYLVNGAWR